MTQILKKSLVAAGALLALSATSRADVLASWDTWTDSAANTYNADAELAGFQGVISTTDPNNRALSGFGSNDGTFGSLAGANGTDETGLLVRKTDAPVVPDKGYNVVTISLTNGTASAFSIDSIHFDLGVRGTPPNESGDAFTLQYTSGGLGVAGTSIGSATGITLVGNIGNADDFNYTLAGFLSDTTLGIGETATFTLTVDSYGSPSASSFLDNVAFQGTAVPEPSSFALLAGCFGMAWVMLRRRA